jgi:hypothetical protein
MKHKGGNGFRTRLISVCLWSALGAWFAGLSHVSSQELEYKVKAAYVLNFLKVVDWPAQTFATTNAPIRIGVVGKDPFGPAWDTIAAKIVDGRKLAIQHFAKVEDLEFCHLLFISRSEEDRLERVLDQIRTAPCLTVSEMDQFIERGGMINFLLIEGRVRFELNVAAAKRAGLALSSQLIRAAERVLKEPRKEGQ